MASTEQPQTIKVKEKKEQTVISFIQSVLKEIAEFKGWEPIFQILFYGFIGWGVYNFYLIYEFHTSSEWSHITKYSVYDFKIGLLYGAVFLFYKHACLFLFYNAIKRNLDPEKHATEEERAKRAHTCTIWLGNIIYYTFSTGLAFYLFKDEYFFPRLLGGNGECIDILQKLPSNPDVPNAVLFYMMQFGWHIYTTIDYMVYKWKDPKFWEMFLHHFVAVFLIVFSYLTNQLVYGLLIFYTHDPCDIFLCFTRFYSDMKKRLVFIKVISYLGFIATWVYCRLFAFPKCIVGSSLVGLSRHDWGRLYSIYLYQVVMMMALVVLHFYWFVFIMRIFVLLIMGKSNYNLYDNSKKKNK